MNFKTLESKCQYYRSLTDYKLIPNSYVIIMLDGRGFSKAIKNKFEKPFDDDFIYMMNETAKYLCENIQGCKFGYVQSDEISLILTDFDTPTTDSFFGNRISKIQSIVASMASGKFNQLMILHKLKNGIISDNNEIEKLPIYQFDCKCWNVPTYNDVFAWILWRQNDCVKNSKQQTAQTYLPHKLLLGKRTDNQIEILMKEKNIDWNSFEDYKKYGRFVMKKNYLFNNIESGELYQRSKWEYSSAFLLNDKYGKEKFNNLNVIPVIGIS
jgi:tRNA(His) 5'-end guanylyltransferase